MEKAIAQDVPENKRAQFVMDSCDKIEKTSYTKRYTDSELAIQKDELAEIVLLIEELTDEKKRLTEKINLQIKEQRIGMKELLTGIRAKGELVTEDCYLYTDEENKRVGVYNSMGELVFERPMRPEEMQHTIPFRSAMNE